MRKVEVRGGKLEIASLPRPRFPLASSFRELARRTLAPRSSVLLRPSPAHSPEARTATRVPARCSTNRTKITVVGDGSCRHAISRYTVLDTYGAKAKPVAILLQLSAPRRLPAPRQQQLRLGLQAKRAQCM